MLAAGMVHVVHVSIGGIRTGSSGRTYAMETNNLSLKIYIFWSFKVACKKQLIRTTPIMPVTPHGHFKNCGPRRAAGGRLKTASSDTLNPKMTAKRRTDKVRHATNVQ